MTPHLKLVAIGAVTLVALALRLQGFDQSLYGDELFTYDAATRSTPGGVIDARPLGLAVCRFLGENLYSPRNLIASLPAVCLLLGYLASRLRAPLAVATAPLLIAGTAIGGFKAVSDAERRTPWKDAAELLDSEADPGDGVLPSDLVAEAAGGGALARSLSIHIDRPHRLFHGQEGWPKAARGERMFVAADLPPHSRIVPKPPPDVARRYRLVRRQAFPGFNEVVVFTYARAGRSGG